MPPDPQAEARRLVDRWRRLVDEIPDRVLDDELVQLLEIIHHHV